MTAKTLKMHLLTYGCQMSVRDSETLKALSQDLGYTPTADLTEADLILVTTCSVRESAERKILGRIGQLKELKDRNPLLIIAVCGCMVQQPRAAEAYRRRAPHVDLWMGTLDYDRFSELLEQIRSSRETGEQKKIVCVSTEKNPSQEVVPAAERGNLKAAVTIMYGCDNYCAYCIVPYVRGRERSRPPADILAEVRDLAAHGCREVTLLGQNVNSYGQKDGFRTDFADLLQEIDAVDGLWRVRFTTSHPKDLNDKLIQTIAQGKNLCEHIHLPFQAGDNRVLAAMNRGYTREYYLERVAAIRDQIPTARLTTDIIVGFPGESEEEFEQTVDLVTQVHFSQAFMFMYSKRSGTKAAAMPDQIPLDVKRRRLADLMRVQNERSLLWRQNLVGTQAEVLVEGVSKTAPEFLTGRTRGNEVVVFPSDGRAEGRLAQVFLERTNSWTLFGKFSDAGKGFPPGTAKSKRSQ